MAEESTLAIIELNDSEIRVARGTNIVLRSPGFAIVGERSVKVGGRAMRKAWLNPRATQNRYWQHLNLDPLPNPSARARHHADLAYAHLLAIYERADEPDEVVFAVPGHYRNEELALLLGLVESSPFTAVGLVDAAVAAAAAGTGPGQYLHAELYLHQVLLTRIEIDEDVARGPVAAIDGAGWARMLDDCADRVADLFIRQSRFDPQHHAETEQILYDQIPRAMRALHRETETAIEIPHHDTTYHAKLARATVLEVLEPSYRRIREELAQQEQVLLGDRLGRLPGFAEMIEPAGVLPADAVFETCRTQLDRIRSSGPALDFVTRLAVSAGEARTATKPEPAPSAIAAQEVESERSQDPPVTHVLCGHEAFPLGDGRVYLDGGECRLRTSGKRAHAAAWVKKDRASVQALNGQQLLLNGKPVDSQVVVGLGDRLGFAEGSTEYVFIHVQH